jgi:hypothetical protein
MEHRFRQDLRTCLCKKKRSSNMDIATAGGCMASQFLLGWGGEKKAGAE